MARRLLIAYGVLGFAFLYLPIAFLVLFSFNDNIIPSLPFRGFTLQWYRELGFDFVLHDALDNSLVIAAITTVTSTALGTLAAFPLVRCTFRFKRAAHAHDDPAHGDPALPDGRGPAALLRLPAPAAVPADRRAGTRRVHRAVRHPHRVRAPVRLRPLPRAGGGRPRRHAGAGVLARDLAADPARGGGRGALRVHAVDGRVPHHVLRLRPEGDAHDVYLEPAEGRHRPPGECPRQRAPGRLLRPLAGGRVAARPRDPRGGHREAADRGKDACGRDGVARAVHGRRSRLAGGPDLQPGLRGGRGAPAAPARGVRAVHGHQRARGGAHVQEPRRARGGSREHERRAARRRGLPRQYHLRRIGEHHPGHPRGVRARAGRAAARHAARAGAAGERASRVRQGRRDLRHPERADPAHQGLRRRRGGHGRRRDRRHHRARGLGAQLSVRHHRSRARHRRDRPPGRAPSPRRRLRGRLRPAVSQEAGPAHPALRLRSARGVDPVGGSAQVRLRRARHLAGAVPGPGAPEPGGVPARRLVGRGLSHADDGRLTAGRHDRGGLGGVPALRRGGLPRPEPHDARHVAAPAPRDRGHSRIPTSSAIPRCTCGDSPRTRST